MELLHGIKICPWFGSVKSNVRVLLSAERRGRKAAVLTFQIPFSFLHMQISCSFSFTQCLSPSSGQRFAIQKRDFTSNGGSRSSLARISGKKRKAGDSRSHCCPRRGAELGLSVKLARAVARLVFTSPFLTNISTSVYFNSLAMVVFVGNSAAGRELFKHV